MVLRLKTRESRSLPGLLKANEKKHHLLNHQNRPKATNGPPSSGPFAVIQNAGQNDICRRQNRRYFAQRQKQDNAGRSSPVARQAHNLKAAGSNPAPATKFLEQFQQESPPIVEGFLAFGA